MKAIVPLCETGRGLKKIGLPKEFIIISKLLRIVYSCNLIISYTVQAVFIVYFYKKYTLLLKIFSICLFMIMC